jgi:hypothetical protein
MAPSDDDPRWTRQLLTGLAALVAISLLVGGVVAVMALAAAKVTGIGESSAGATVEPSLYIPSGRPTTRPQAYPDPPDGSAGSAEASSSASTPSDKPTKKKRKPRPLTLQAFPVRVSSGERINLTGVYERGEGRVLQVQRFEGSWTDFPVTATVSGGIYETYVYSGQVGRNRFRMLDTGSGRASNPVTINIR